MRHKKNPNNHISAFFFSLPVNGHQKVTINIKDKNI